MAEKSNAKLIIHTGMQPQTPEQKKTGTGGRGAVRRNGVRWKCVERPGRRNTRRRRLTAGERLMRNSAVACALLLGILALRNVEQPWAKGAIRGVEQALTMRVDLDDTLGGLKFVKNLVPESALVFFQPGGAELCRPVKGTVRHPWNVSQPWVLFECGGGETVSAAADGTITAISALSGGGYGMILDHGDGLESVYAYLSETSAETGKSVCRGDPLGKTEESAGLYYELRQSGTAVDPGDRMGL